MKLHLPVRLFRAVIALMAVAMPFSASAAQKYTVSNGQQLTLSGLDELDLDISKYYVSGSASTYGGAIYATGTGVITIEHYVNLLFNKNYVSCSGSSSYYYYSDGGAIYSSNGAITLSGNESVTFSGNSSSCSSSSSSSSYSYYYSDGGAIYSSNGAITLSGNKSITFSGNWCQSSASRYTASGSGISSSYGTARGGAIYGKSTLTGSDSILFSGNYTSATSVSATISEATALGGAIYGSISLTNNGGVIFRGNSVRAEGAGTNTARGGAIYGDSVSIRNNKTVVFEGNYEKTGDSSYTYRLRGLYSTGAVDLSAAEGDSIKFRDSMYTGGNLLLNEQYEGISQTGDIIFSGEYTKKHLSELKSSYTAAELRNSLTSTVVGQTELYDGRLIVREGAILKGAGMTVHTSASGECNTTVFLQNAQLNQGDHDITFASGTVMEAGGISEMTGNRWTMADGSTITLHAAAENAATAVLSYNGHFLMGENLTLNISFNPEDAKSGAYKLLNVTTFVDEINWTAENVTVNGLGGFEMSFDDLYWDDEILYFNYVASTTDTPGSSGTGTGGGSATPYMFLGTWTNEAGNGRWDTTSLNWEHQDVDFAYEDGLDIVFGDEGAGTVTLVGDHAPGSVLVNSAEDYTWVADEEEGGSLTGALVLTKQGDGTLSICTDNSYLGGTHVEDGRLVVGHDNALGKGGVVLRGGVLDMAGYSVSNDITASGGTLTGANHYMGKLTVAGALSLEGANSAYEGIVLTSGSISGGSIADTEIKVNTEGDVAIASTLSGESMLVLEQGTLSLSGANTHTGGTLLKGGKLSLGHTFALGNSVVSAMGINTLHADAEAVLASSILNSGTLTLSGSWNISELEVDKTAATHIDTEGRSGNSGFAKSALYEVQVVRGGTTLASDLTLTHSSVEGTLQLGSDGVASAGGVVDYSNYLLTEGDSADASDILSAAGGKLDYVTMTGGNLNVDDSVVVDATGGKITITDDSTLSGSIKDTDVTLGAGDYKSDISADITGDGSLTVNGGDVTLSGNNDYTGGTTVNGGNLTIGDGTSLGTGDVIINGGTLDLNDNTIGNDITLNNGNLVGGDNYNGNLSIGGDNVTVEGGYTLSAGSVLEIAPGGTAFGSDLTLAGGTLLFKGAPLTVDGAVSFAAGTTTLVDLRQWEGQLVDGLTLAVLGSGVEGWSDGCLELIGMSDMSLLFDSVTGTLTLQVESEQPIIEVPTITWLGAKNTVWQHGKAGWMNATTGYDAVYENGAEVIFTQSGAVTIAGAVAPGSIIVAGDKAIAFKSDKANPGRIVGETSLIKRGNGQLTLNDGNSYTGGTFIEAGTVVAGGAASFGSGAITISGGTLDLKGKAVLNDIALIGAATIKNGKTFGGELVLDGELLKGSTLNIAEKAEIKSGLINGTLSGVGTVTVSGEVSLGTTGKLTTNGLEIDGSLAVCSKGLAMNSKTSAITVHEGGSLISDGVINAYSMEINGGSVDIAPIKASSVTLTDSLHLNNAAMMNLNGKLSAKGSVTIEGDSKLILSGALSAKNLTLGSGDICMTSTKLQTIKVSNELTLNGGTDLNFGFSVTQSDVDKNKAFKILTFKVLDAAIEAEDLYNLLGLSKDICTLDFDKSRKSITLVVEDYEEWNKQAEAVRNGELATAVEEAEDMLFAPATSAGAMAPELMKAADTLVQSTWGTVGASRAFGDTIANRGTHATLLEGGKGAAWISTMGGSSRISSEAGHAGADYTLTGAAFGIEAHLSADSTLGIAIGNSWGKVSTFSAYPVDQDSTHAGIYGNHKLNDTLSLSWMAAHTRTESDVNLAGMPCTWSQDALQLDARLTWAKALTARTSVNAFGGLQYLATDRGECNGIKTGSLQNLRAEIGVGATHRITGDTMAYGELSFIGDVVRNNPTAALGGLRTHGTNPGRAGMNLSVGATHRLNDDWSVNATYNLELMQNITSHGLNVGATYSF